MKDNTLFKYTLAEELISSISHGIGAILAVVASVLMIIKSCMISPLAIVAVSIYSFSIIVEYTISTIYHSLSPNRGKKVLRVLDHCFIFLLIIGTYAPYTLITLNFNVGIIPLGITLFAINCIAGTVGITLTAIDMKKYSKLAMVCYIAMGWVIIIAIKPLIDTMPLNGLLLLLAGGISYTVGAVFYGVGKRKKYIHSLWHFFVLAGSVFQFFSVYFYVL